MSHYTAEELEASTRHVEDLARREQALIDHRANGHDHGKHDRDCRVCRYYDLTEAFGGA